MKLPKKFLRLIVLCLGGIVFTATKMERRKKVSWSRILGVLCLLGALTLVTALYTVWSKYNNKFLGQTNNCAVVFGAAVWRDDKPSHALYDRTVAGINLFNGKQVDCLVFSGGESTYGAHEVDVMTKIALDSGVPQEAIIKDYYGHNTLATLQNLPKKPGYVFVSNDFHLGRIGLIANRLELENYYLHAASYLQGRYLKEGYFFIREIAGVLLYGFFSPLMWG